MINRWHEKKQLCVVTATINVLITTKCKKSDKKSKKNLNDEIDHDRPNHGDTYNYIYGRFSVLIH